MPTFGSLFAGIGGIDLGLERAGWTGRWQVEWDPFCRRVLAHHWPDVARVGDIHDAHGAGACPVADARNHGLVEPDGGGLGGEQGPPSSHRAAQAGGTGHRSAAPCPGCLPPVDLIAGGFPCQPVSVAGKGRAQSDERWLWPQFARIVRDLGPRFVLVENVRNLLAVNDGTAFGEVLGDLAALGYDARWDCIPAAAVGAPHLRDRVWVVASRAEQRWPLADPDHGRSLDAVRARRDAVGDGSADVAHAEGQPIGTGLREDGPGGLGRGRSGNGGAADVDAPGEGARPGGDGDWWAVEPDVGRVAHGVPGRVDRLRALGNAVVPQVVEAIGREMMARWEEA